MLIERDEALESLLGAARHAAAGHGGTVILGGEAGIGKTSMLGEFTRKIGDKYRVLWGGCEALFTPRPLGPLQDMAPMLDPRVAALLDEAAAPERLFPTLLNSLQEAAKTTVLVFEDVHWADNATLDLVKYLGRRMPLVRALLVLTLRSDEIGVEHPLTQVLGDLPPAAITRIALQPLSPEGVALLAQQSGRSSADLHRVTAGNPFFVTELLAATTPMPVADSAFRARCRVVATLTPGESRARTCWRRSASFPGASNAGCCARFWARRPMPRWTAGRPRHAAAGRAGRREVPS